MEVFGEVIWSSITLAVLVAVPGAPAIVRILIVAVALFDIVPSKQVTVPPASEHVPTFVFVDIYITSVGKGSVTITLVALPGPLLAIPSVYMSGSPDGTFGLGVALLEIVMLALLALPTTTTAVALLLVKFGTMLLAVAVAVSAILVPEAVPEFTCNTIVKPAVPFTARLASVHVIVPVAPTAGVVQPQPLGIMMDWKFVFGGVDCVKLTDVAAAGPLLVTLCV